MKRIFTFFFRLLVLLIIVTLATGGTLSILGRAKTDIKALPELQDGDLIFQTNINSQMPAILLATHSFYSHAGVIRKTEKGVHVVEAMRHVTERSLEDFVHSGWGERITILRMPNLTDQQRADIVRNTQSYIGKPYDFVFYQSEDQIYCSELPYLAYKHSGIALGKVEKISELHLDNFAVRKLFAERWQMHPACKKPGMDAASCWKTVLEEPIITPAGVANDAQLKVIFNNYWF